MDIDEKTGKTIKGRGAQQNSDNPFEEKHYIREHPEALDEEFLLNEQTKIYYEHPKKIVNKVVSPDVGAPWSINPYQGCEHGCIYCYARNTHHYWGFSAGLDFERKIIVKQNAPELLEKHFQKKSWKPEVIMVSGNTDCYQPLERKLEITRDLLKVFLKFRNPLGLITKNSLILRDIDLLQELAKNNLVHVRVSVTTLDEKLRQKLEPRTATAQKRIQVIEELSKAGISTGAMVAPIIPGLNSSEIPAIIKAVADNGGVAAGYTMVRLNGAIGELFEDWIKTHFPEKAEKVLNQIKAVHGGSLNDSRFGTRMRGEGNIADSIRQLFHASVKKHGLNKNTYRLNTKAFCRPPENGQMSLFS